MVDLTHNGQYALATEVIKMDGLLKVLQESRRRPEFEEILSRFFIYTDEQLIACINACTLSWS